MKQFLLSMLLSLLIPQAAVAQEAYAVLDGSTLTFYYDNLKSTRRGTKYGLNSDTSSPGWYSGSGRTSKVVFTPSFADARPTSTCSWFGNHNYLTEIEGIQYLNTSSVTTMQNMFYNCSSLTSLDVSGFDTGNVTDMSYMFSGCSGLTSLDVSGFNTANVTDMRYMFQGCSSLTSLNISGFDTGEVTNMQSMFDGCSSLTILDLSEFDTRNVTNMFGMFQHCYGLSTLDLSGFDTRNVTTMFGMFIYCSSLVTIYCGYDWNANAVENDFSMFYDCTSLVGGEGTVYTSSQTGKAYAHADGGISNPGYLTLKSVPSGITIEPDNNTEVLDDHDGETNDVTLDFSISSGKWITLCLPFDATTAQTRAALGDDVDIEELSTSTWNDETKYLTLNFVPRNAIVAGRPYVVKVGATVNNPTFSGVTINNAAPTTVTTTYCSMTGVYNATPVTAGDKNTLFIQNNQFYYPSTAGSLPATKCYFTLLGDGQQASRMGMRFWDDDDVASGIYAATPTTVADSKAWYTPQGIRVNSPGKGLYIHGGKKVVVK